MRGAPETFASFHASETTRTPAQILAHVGDLLDWALSIAKGAEAWNNSESLPWDQEVARFHRALESFDNYLASDAELSASCERLFQGPIADALTHVGQLTMLRRLAGGPIKGGQVYGKTDEKAYHVDEDAVSVADFITTIAKAMGMPYDQEIRSPEGRPFTLGNHGTPIAKLF